MFERFTEKARRVIFFARYEASQFGCERIETEHILLGLFRDKPLAARFLGPQVSTSSVSGRLEAIRTQIEAATQRREKVSTSGDLPLSRESKNVLSYGAEEAERLNHPHIGTEHLLLGLLREEGSLAARILGEQGLRLSLVREEITRSMPAVEVRTGFAPFRTHRSASVGQWPAALEDAGRVAQMARYAAVCRNSPCIETTDLLLALTHEKEVAERFLIPVESVRKHRNLEPQALREKVSAAELPFSEDCKTVFNFAIEEAAQFGQRTAPAHLLLGILRLESCAAAEILRECGLTEAAIRAQLRPPPPLSDPEQGRHYV